MADDTNPQDEKKEPTPGQIKFQQSIAEHGGEEIAADTQDRLNKPFSDSSTSLDEADKAFLDDLMGKIDSGDINLLSPSSILNESVYEGLPGEDKVKADLFIQSILFVLRQIHDFYASENSNDSDMMISMVKELRLKKETLENEVGDVLKI